jgi:Glycosyltransferase family 10 (fucosyltransferase) C-term
MPHPKCFTSSSIGPCPDLHKNFLNRSETVSITWDDGFSFEGDDSFFRVYHRCEPPEVIDCTDKLIANHKFYDLILAFDERVLRECPNSVFLTESACSWLPRKTDGTIDPLGLMNHDGILHKNPVELTYTGCDVTKKDFAVSFLTSSKNAFPGHRLRQEIFEKLPASVGDLRVWKHRSPPIVNDKRTILEPYMFSIVPENSQHAGYYTEKLIDCFVAKTIPIYWGCPNLADHFNLEGVLRFTEYSDLQQLLGGLTPERYHSKREAIEENFHLAVKGSAQWDQIENNITLGIQRKLKGQGFQRVDSIPVQTASESRYGRLYRPLRIAK